MGVIAPTALAVIFLPDETMLTLLDCSLLFTSNCSSFMENRPSPHVLSSSADPLPSLTAEEGEATALNDATRKGHDVGWNWDLCGFLGQTLCASVYLLVNMSSGHGRSCCDAVV